MATDYYTVEEAAKAAGRSIWTIYRWARENRLEAFRDAAGRVLIPVAEIEKIAALRPYSAAGSGK